MFVEGGTASGRLVIGRDARPEWDDRLAGASADRPLYRASLDPALPFS